MKSQSLHHSSHLRFGIAALSAALVTLLGGVSSATAQSSPSGVKIPVPPGSALLKPTAGAPQNAARKGSHPLTALPPIVVAKHPINTPMALADPMALAGPRVALKGHVPGLVAHASKLDAVDASKQITLTFALQPRNKAQMDDLAHRLYDPKDPQFQKFLTPAQRIARFSPSQEDFNKVVAFAQQSGLQVTDSTPDRQLIMATGTAAQIQNALGVHLHNYKAEDGREFYAPDADPSLPQGIAALVQHIVNLSNASIARPLNIPRSSLPPKSGMGGTGGSGGSGISPDDIGQWSGKGMPAAEITKCYDLKYSIGSTPITGAGQRLALVELGGFDPNDIGYYLYYNANNATPTENLDGLYYQTHLMNGYGGGINRDSGEVELDFELIEAVTDDLSLLDVYEEDYNGSIDQELVQIMNDDVDNQISISYGSNEIDDGSGYALYIADLTEELALQGQAVFVSSGDSGAYSGDSQLTVNVFAASPWVTGVGGTTLWINESNNYGAFYYENAWNDGGATGGGVSVYNAIPTYQYNYLVNNSASWNSPTSFYNRNVPDVALDSDPYTGYYVHALGNDAEYGGTSCAAPIWAAFWAQVNQTRAINGAGPMGFANPALYAIAEGGNYNYDFHDVYGGANNGYYWPEYGYDCTTGLGSIEGLNMIDDLPFNYGPWSPSESFYVIPSTVTSGQQVYLEVLLNPTVPTYGSAKVVYAQVIGGYAYQLGVDTVGGGATYDLFAFAAPDVKTATSETYICYVIYYDNNGQQRGGAYWSNEGSTTVSPNTIASASVSGTAYDGQSVTGTITLNAPAYQNEQIDLTSSDPTHVMVPASVTVESGFQSATFTINTKLVTASEQVTITANSDSTNSGLGAGQATTQVTVAPLLSSIKMAPASITGGLSGKGTINLLAPAPANGVVVTLKSANAAASVPSSVTVPAGATSFSFPITTTAVTATVSGKISATHGAAVKSANLKVLPVGVKSVSFSPTSVVGGGSVTGKVTLVEAAAPGSITVSLSSNTPSVATPTVTSITIPAGSTTGTFTVKTNTVSATTLVNITATANGIKKSKTLKVTP